MENKLPLMRPAAICKSLLQAIDYVSKSIDITQATMIEIGSFTGESTVMFAARFKKVISVDPFITYAVVSQISTLRKYKQDKWDQVMETFKERTKPFANITHLRLLSDEAVEKINEPIDFVYIDGSHTYEQCKKDIQNYLSLIKENGIIGGHDYQKGFPGVVKAVNEVFGAPDIVFGTDGNWIKEIKL